MPSAGKLRERVRIDAPIVTRDSFGGEKVTGWTEGPTVWADVEPLRAREFFAAQAAQSTCDHKVTIRFRAGVTAKHRLVWRGQALDIVGEPIDVKAQRVWLELLCVKGIRDGR